MRYKHKRSRATDIPREVKDRVYERDGGRCIFCGKAGLPNAHYIGRGQGGLGIEQNIVTACPECHRELDNGLDIKTYRAAAKAYLERVYKGSWDVTRLVYRKGDT